MVPGWCGCCTCTYFLDRYTRDDSGDLGDDWDEQLGSWSIENYRAKTTSSNARLICNAVDTPNNDPHVVSAALRGMGLGDQPRLISSKVSGADTYWFFQMTYGATTVDLDLYQRTAGSDVQRGSTTTLYNMAPGIPLALRIAFDETEICGQYRRITDTIWTTATSYATTDITDSICGVGTGTVNNEVRVDDFRLEKHGTLYPQCPTCAAECWACIGPMPAEFLIVPTGNLETLDPLLRPLFPENGYVLRRVLWRPCVYEYELDPPVYSTYRVTLEFGTSIPGVQVVVPPGHAIKLHNNLLAGYFYSAEYWWKQPLDNPNCGQWDEEQPWPWVRRPELRDWPPRRHLYSGSGIGWKATALW